MASARFLSRMKREIELLERDPPHGISAWPKNDHLMELEANIQGPVGTPYEHGVFKLEINLTENYPIDPPKVRFVTQIYHPNIDNGGRICLDILNTQPKGAWKPSLNISTVLTSIQSLMAEPNPDDGLMAEITQEYRHNPFQFSQTAKKWTQMYAITKSSSSGHSDGSQDNLNNNPQSNSKSIQPKLEEQISNASNNSNNKRKLEDSSDDFEDFSSGDEGSKKSKK